MVTVEVTSGSIIHDRVKYTIGKTLEVSEERGKRFELLKVAKIVGQIKQEDQPVVLDPESKETTEQPAGPVEPVKQTPVEKPKKKRGRKRG